MHTFFKAVALRATLVTVKGVVSAIQSLCKHTCLFALLIAGPPLVTAADNGPPPVVGGQLGEPVHPLGEQSTVVLLVNFSDSAGDTPYSIQQVEQTVFGTVSEYFAEASSGQTWLAGDVYGWFTLPIASTCNTVEIGNAADEAAMAAGIDLSGYYRFVYIFRGSATCSWNGSADLWVYPSRAWIRGNIVPQIIAHEMGHNLGLEHAYQLECGEKVIDEISPDCRYARDDKFDAMGSANDLAHFNTFQKDRLGWMRPGEVKTVTEDGSYTLSPMELGDTPHPKALKILRSVEPNGEGATWYYLEYRQALGFDGFIAGNSNVENGILVRTGEDFDANSSLLLDMTPASSVLVSQDRSDPALVVGATYTDPVTGLTLTTEWADGNTASVRVTFGPGGGGDCCVAPANTAPEAMDDQVNLSEKAPVTIAVLANDFDPDGDTLYLESTGQGSKGAVTMNADGSLSYVPGRRFKTSDSFSYTMSDGEYSATATVYIELQSQSGGAGGKGGGKGKK